MSDATTKAYGPFTEKLAALESQLAAERKRADEAERLELERDDARRRIDCGELEGEGCRLDDDVCFRHYLAERSNDAFDIEEALGATNEDDLCGWHQIAPFAEKVRRERDELRARVGELERAIDCGREPGATCRRTGWCFSCLASSRNSLTKKLAESEAGAAALRISFSWAMTHVENVFALANRFDRERPQLDTARLALTSDIAGRALLESHARELAEAHAKWEAEASTLRTSKEDWKAESHRRGVALDKINAIRNSIVALQSINWSEHIYPLVAALNEAGIEGEPYPGNREYLGTIIDQRDKAMRELAEERAKTAELNALINTPEVIDFVVAVQLEAAHQRARWGSDHDAGKADVDWFWLIGYLAGKALHNPIKSKDSDEQNARELQLHRIITIAAAAANWHAAKLGKTNMRPGIKSPEVAAPPPPPVTGTCEHCGRAIGKEPGMCRATDGFHDQRECYQLAQAKTATIAKEPK